MNPGVRRMEEAGGECDRDRGDRDRADRVGVGLVGVWRNAARTPDPVTHRLNGVVVGM